MGYNFRNDNTSNIIQNAAGATSRITMSYGAVGIYTGGVNTEPTNLGYYQNSSGYVGIGTSAPSTLLHVSTAAGGGGIGILEDRSTGSADVQLQFRSQYAPLANGSKICGAIYGAPSNTGGRLTFHTAQNTTGTLTERVRIDDFGYINFGTGDTGLNFGTSDSSTGFWIRNDGSNTVISTKKGSIYYGYGGATGISHIFYSGAGPTESMRLSGGYLGIGTVPGNPLDVWNNANSAVYNQVGNFVVTNNLGGTNWSRFTITQISTNMMGLEAANQANTKGSLMLQPYGGTVGIGTTNTPTTALAVQGNIALCGGTSLDFSATGQATRYGYIYHNSSYMEFNNQQNGVMIFSTNNAEKMRISNVGDLSLSAGSISVARTKAVQFDGNVTSLDMSIHMPNTFPFGLRLSGANDATNTRNTQFGYYNTGVWQNRAEINNYTGTLSLYSTMAVKATAPTAADYTCSNNSVGGPSSYINYRLLMYDSGVAADSYGFGVESFTNWANSYQSHKWYARNVQTMLLDGSGNLTITGVFAAPLSTPASSAAAGTTGQIKWDANYIYVCTATNTWKRVALSTF